MTEAFPTDTQVVIIGGGVIGTACAFQLHQFLIGYSYPGGD